MESTPTVAEAEAEQRRLAAQVVIPGERVPEPRTVVGLAVSYATDLLLGDGQGIAHPRRCGLASHLGVVLDRPSIGSAKNHLTGEHVEPGPCRGDREPLVDAGVTVGEVVRTQDRTRPVYVSPGHLVGVAQAGDVVLDVTGRYRVPDPIRLADQISRRALRAT